MATQSPYSLPVLGLLASYTVLASISLSLLQKSTGSYPKSRCLTAETMTCHQATMWCPSRCSLLRINQRCSAARASSGSRPVLYPPPTTHLQHPLLFKTALGLRCSCTTRLEHRGWFQKLESQRVTTCSLD